MVKKYLHTSVVKATTSKNTVLYSFVVVVFVTFLVSVTTLFVVPSTVSV
jgi:hypothetical protein